MDLLIKGLLVLFIRSFQSELLIPCTNLFALKVGLDTIATMSPVKISITQIDPLLPFSSSLANLCASASRVILKF